MRKKIVAGNWKMNKDFNESCELIESIVSGINRSTLSENQLVIIAPPFPFLSLSAKITEETKHIFVAAQNCHSEEKGAYTGEVSASMIRSTGAKYVIIGHSERRNYFKESNEFLSKKVDSALKNELIPIFCCGEILSERESENHFSVIKQQLNESLFHLNEIEINNIIIAYEPVWAIGTGVTASPQQAQEMHLYIRNLIAEAYNLKIAKNISILYGGSCNAKNAKELFANPDVDGGLIGGASLISDDFINIVNSF